MLILNKNYKNILFIHIPKTAGISIFKIIDSLNLDNWKRSYLRRHDPYFSLDSENVIDNSTFSFAVARNPYTRTYSCFNQFNKTNKTNLSFSQYLINIKNNNISKETPLLHLPQSFYVVDKQNNLVVNKIYRFENLLEIEKDFSWKLEYNNVGNYLLESYNEAYTDKNIDIVQELYSSDFNNFGYSKIFNMIKDKNG